MSETTGVTITPLGSGNWQLGHRFQPSFLLQYKHDPQDNLTNILVDSGYGAMHRLLQVAVNPCDLRAIHVTHFHPDHVADLVPLIDQRIMHERADGKQHRPWTITGPVGLREYIETIHVLQHSTGLLKNGGRDAMETHEYGAEEFAWNKRPYWQCIPFGVFHDKEVPCLGYRFEVHGKIIVFTGDLGTRQPQPKSFQQGITGADIVVIEAGAPEPAPSHLTLEQAIEIGAKHAKRVVINHIRPSHYEEAIRKLRTMPASIQEKVTFAVDLHPIKV